MEENQSKEDAPLKNQDMDPNLLGQHDLTSRINVKARPLSASTSRRPLFHQTERSNLATPPILIETPQPTTSLKKKSLLNLPLDPMEDCSSNSHFTPSDLTSNREKKLSKSSPRSSARRDSISKSPRPMKSNVGETFRPPRSLLPKEKSFFHINVETIILETKDGQLYGRTLAYHAEDFQVHIRDRSKETNTSIWSIQAHILNITILFNQVQHEKLTILKQLASLIDISYFKEKRTSHEHSKFCKKIIEITDRCMSTSLDLWQKVPVYSSAFFKNKNKTPGELVALYWKELAGELETNNLHTFEKKLAYFVELFNKAFFYQNKLHIVKDIHLPQVASIDSKNYFSWPYLGELLSADYLQLDVINKMKALYLEKNNLFHDNDVFIYDLYKFIYDEKSESNNKNLIIMELMESALKYYFPDEHERFIKQLNIDATIVPTTKPLR